MISSLKPADTARVEAYIRAPAQVERRPFWRWLLLVMVLGQGPLSRLLSDPPL
ncbi:DUF3094 family protein [Pseudomonas sp. 15A4]|uniref:DUF3094 family protein n=1 Tax=Pseudomonas sp. 15A4 TaxID=2804761 RepID=UPI001967991E|nr:DUF3094 family protein [Pseudomonas sp. 15A4]QSB19678.1 DUF3094 family protein [Pseudomonas sp. 15A4]